MAGKRTNDVHYRSIEDDNEDKVNELSDKIRELKVNIISYRMIKNFTIFI